MLKANHNLRLVHALPREPKEILSVLDLIGNTPLLEIRKIAEGLPAGVRVFAKLEGFNPGGSVKDRPALRMVQEGLKSGKLHEGKIILESSSGNTGIAYAMIAVVLVHLLGLALHTIRHRENIALSMVNGLQAGDPRDAIRSARPLVGVAFLLVTGLWLSGWLPMFLASGLSG